MLKTRLFHYRYLPARIKPPREKVMLVFHGLGDSLNGYAWLPAELGVDELSFLMVNAPDPYYGGYSWFDFMDDSGPGIIRSRALICQLIEELRTQGVHAEDMFLFGFSQGGLMALDVGLRVEHRLAGVCSVSGYVFFLEEYPGKFSSLALKQKFLATHGLHDPVVPCDTSRRQYETLKSMGVDLAFLTYPKDHTILPEELDDIKSWVRERLKVRL